MRQSGVDTLITEEPDDRIGQVRICGGDGQQWPSLPGIPPILPSRGEYSDLLEGKFEAIYEYNVYDSQPATFLVAQTFEKGHIVATGSWRMFINDYMQDSAVDNLRLFRHSVLWLLGGSS